MRWFLIATLLVTLLSAPAHANPSTGDSEDSAEMDYSAPDAPAGEGNGALGGLDAPSLQSMEHQLSNGSDSSGQISRLLRIVKALKNGGKDLTVEDIDMLESILNGMVNRGEQPELSGALAQLMPQLEALKRQKQNPESADDDEIRSLLDN